MADAPYLVALALEEKGGERALPLTGKSQSAAAVDALDSGRMVAPWPWSCCCGSGRAVMPCR